MAKATPSTTEESVVGVYGSLADARLAMDALEHSDFPNRNVSLVTASVRSKQELHESLQTGDETEHNAARGAGLGALAGMLLSAPLLAIPGLGFVLAVGPLAGGLTGAIVGGILGALSGWGVHEDHIGEYEQMLKQGKALVVAHGSPEQVMEAERILHGTSAELVRLHAASADESPEVDDRPWKGS